MNNKTKHIQQIKAYFNGQLSAQEEQDLHSWLKADETNLAFFKAEKESLDPNDTQHHLLESSLSELKMKLDLNHQYTPGKKIYLTFSRIAALFILVVGLSFIFSLVINNFKNTEQEIVWFETTAPRGEKSKINLPDGSVVWLNSETTIRYPNNFTANNRQIKLHGEAYFEVVKYNDATFSVITDDYSINVLGTKFNVMAYNDFGRTQTALIEGKIQIQKENKIIDIKPGEEIIFENNHFTIKEKNTKQSMVWKDNKFDFDQIPFAELVKRLERWYNVDIVIKGAKLPEKTYSGVFKNEETIWQVLDVLQISMPFEYKRIDFRKIELTTKQ